MARYGGGLHLFNSVVFIQQYSELFFDKNHATANGGAINIIYTATDLQFPNACPIQFIGYSNATVFSLAEIGKLDLNITFVNNTARSLSRLESIYSDVFYLCAWYPNTLTQINLGITAPFINGMRPSVYREIFHFIPANTVNEHLSIEAYLPCPCDDNNTFNAEYCLTADHNKTLGTIVIVGRSFTINLATLDVVGSLGYSIYLSSKVSSFNTTDEVLQLPSEQLSRVFNTNRSCTPIDFTIYSLRSTIPKVGILQLSIVQVFNLNLYFNLVDECPTGFSLHNANGLYACTCGEFFNKSPIKEDFQCDSVSGKITRIDVRSWLSVISDRVEYTRLCLPEYCNNIVSEFNSTDINVLCNSHRTGRGCGACVDGFGKGFGTKYCIECSNVWLLTVALYVILGIILVLIIHLLKLTITMGTINGLIFFCNIMSINENLFFNTTKFSFVRLFVSLINLDLGFEMCFYREMSETVKTGLQFVFPLYLWLLMFIIIMVGKYYIRSKKSTHSAVPVLATLIFLSYSKLLRATFSVFSSVIVYYTTEESNFSRIQQFVAWQPDPNVKYLEGTHIILFLVALVFTLFFILPLAFALTFPKVVLRSKKLSYFFPLLDCIYAPYKNRYRYWFGVRIIVLIFFSGIESILFSHQGLMLLAGAVVVLLFTIIQAYIHPFKSTIINTLDLMSMGIFITLSIVILYMYPDILSREKFMVVNIFGGMAFLLFSFIIIFHLHGTVMYFTWYSRFIEAVKTKFNVKDNCNPLHCIVTRDVSHKPDNCNINYNQNYAYLRESLLEEQFN